MSIPASLTELPCPTNLLPIKSEVFSNPQDRIRHTSELSSTEFLIDPTGVATKTDTTLEPRISPPEPLIVVNSLSSKSSIRIKWLPCNGEERTYNKT